MSLIKVRLSFNTFMNADPAAPGCELSTLPDELKHVERVIIVVGCCEKSVPVAIRCGLARRGGKN